MYNLLYICIELNPLPMLVNLFAWICAILLMLAPIVGVGIIIYMAVGYIRQAVRHSKEQSSLSGRK